MQHFEDHPKSIKIYESTERVERKVIRDPRIGTKKEQRKYLQEIEKQRQLQAILKILENIDMEYAPRI